MGSSGLWSEVQAVLAGKCHSPLWSSAQRALLSRASLFSFSSLLTLWGSEDQWVGTAPAF